MIILHVSNVNNIKRETDLSLIEIKTPKAKNIVKFTYGTFFGITQNEEDLFKARNYYRLCIVHSITEVYVLMIMNKHV